MATPPTSTDQHGADTACISGQFLNLHSPHDGHITFKQLFPEMRSKRHRTICTTDPFYYLKYLKTTECLGQYSEPEVWHLK